MPIDRVQGNGGSWMHPIPGLSPNEFAKRIWLM
jgi:hypothetical protein